jgi:hypothetical protein
MGVGTRESGSMEEGLTSVDTRHLMMQKGQGSWLKKFIIHTKQALKKE